ncbi:hypothetical protein GLAREA_11585 [Glarea lozoyensis ATCC 20868]|uniref:Uncharacterized protein n=1 Tax=Glarea lozoyensis (strain ATCC 20868 / MF5171) TaxID=1116229 RepID=S3CIB1_GLAL2|nr:uncharacterized protein GLAREA_11585 [Glarea lozoyensis ATCC 20868]EPE25004.1 hypothetical protein GLAREA_11585 [Glarea lozoyensis ATCC 20868]
MDKNSRITFQLDSPYNQTAWPEVAAGDQDTILELLCSIVSPVGQWRSNFVLPSKGKRSQKRKRKDAKSKEAKSDDSKPPAPEISSFLEIGLNVVTRRLEEQISKSKDDELQGKPSSVLQNSLSHAEGISLAAKRAISSAKQTHVVTPFVAIFVLRPSQPTVLHAHLPQLIAASSLCTPSLPTPKLVQLPSGCQSRLCEALGLARVNFIGLREGAPNISQLVDLIRTAVPDIKIPWLDEATKAAYLPVKVNAIKTTVGPTNKASLATGKGANQP